MRCNFKLLTMIVYYRFYQIIKSRTFLCYITAISYLKMSYGVMIIEQRSARKHLLAG